MKMGVFEWFELIMRWKISEKGAVGALIYKKGEILDCLVSSVPETEIRTTALL